MLQQVHTKEVGSNVVDDDQGAGQQEPHEPVKDVAHKETGRDEDHQQNHVGPGILRKLVGVHALLQPQDKSDKACRAAEECACLAQLTAARLTRSAEHTTRFHQPPETTSSQAEIGKPALYKVWPVSILPGCLLSDV